MGNRRLVVVVLVVIIAAAGCMGMDTGTDSDGNEVDSTTPNESNLDNKGRSDADKGESDGTPKTDGTSENDGTNESGDDGNLENDGEDESGNDGTDESKDDESKDGSGTNASETDETRSSNLQAIVEYIELDGREREYRVYVPDNSTKPRYPLVVALHGAFQQGVGMERYTSFNRVARKHGFAVVYPNGVNRRWNVEDTLGTDANGTDDVDFISSLVDKLASRYPIDNESFYVTGFSNGGMMSYRLACELERVEAIAPVGGTMTRGVAKDCERSVPVLIFHGTSDPVVSWNATGEEAERIGLYSVPATVEYWEERNNCSSRNQTVIDPRDDGTSVTRTYYDCSVAFGFYAIEKGGHTWPGGKQFLPEAVIGKTTEDIEASSVIWDFFSRIRDQDRDGD